MHQRSVVMTAASRQKILAGPGFLTAPDFVCRLLFASSPEGLAIILTRFAGVCLFSLGIACLLFEGDNVEPQCRAGSLRL